MQVVTHHANHRNKPMKPIILKSHEVIHLRDTGSVIAWRVAKPKPLSGPNGEMVPLGEGSYGLLDGVLSGEWKCPYGRTGEERWVRETFFHEPADYCWEASVSIPSRPEVTVYRADYTGDSRHCGWKSSSIMPRELSRFTVTLDVGLKRIQEVTEEEAVESGVFWFREYCQRGCQDFDESMTDLQLFKVLTEWKNKGLNLDRNDYFWKITCTLKK